MMRSSFPQEITIFAISVFLALAPSARAQETKVDIDALVTETQKQTPASDEMTFVWWIPSEFWRASLEQEKLSKAQIDDFLKILEPYTVVVIVDGKISTSGKVSYRDMANIRRSVRIIDSEGKEHAPTIPGGGFSTIEQVVKPMLAAAMGPLGTNMHFFVFPAKDLTGRPVANPRSSGKFSVRLDAARRIDWQLPLISLLPPKICPVDGIKLNGSYKFCPFHGTELKN